MKKSLNSWAALVVTLPFIVHCGNMFLKPGDAKPEGQPPEAGSHSPSEDPKWNGALRAILIPGKEANRYMVQLQWAAKTRSASVSLTRKEMPNGRASEITGVSATSDSFIDSQVDAGKTYEYGLTGEGVSELISIVVPTDLEYRGTTTIKEPLTANRLFLRDGAQLMIEDREVSISMNEIISENASITTFPSGFRAGVNSDGRKGGTLSLVANQLNGKLSITIRGEHGGQGISGNSGSKGVSGYQGNPVEYVCIAIDPVTKAPGTLDFCRSLQRLGKDPKTLYICKVPATNGTAGGPGSAGGNGGEGRRGGNSGTANVRIKQAALEQLNVSLEPGEAGPGGAGGPGGDGGNGGEAGPEQNGICPAQPGTKGPAGAHGQPGLGGQPGKVESFCAIMGDSKQGNCQ